MTFAPVGNPSSHGGRMADLYFTRIEADQKLGRKVLALSTLGSIPRGARGAVVKVVRSHADQWSVRIRWQLPRQISLIDAAEFSFFKREKPIASELSKSVYEKSIQEI
jgi:hypothetical protein